MVTPRSRRDGKMVMYALTAEGRPLFLISGMAIHTQNVLADERASLLVMQSGNGSDPLGAPRATLSGMVRRHDAVSDAERIDSTDRLKIFLDCRTR